MSPLLWKIALTAWGGGGCNPGSAQLKDVLNQCGLQEMGPTDRRFTWRGPTTQSRLDRFLCSLEWMESFPLALVTALPRPLSDHTPLMWNSNVETEKPPYFKLYRSWYHNEVIKNSIKDWWDNQFVLGAALERLTNKLTGLQLYIISRRRQIREERTCVRDAALARVQELDKIDDNRSLTINESQERKSYQEAVAAADLRVEMDWRQWSRQLWLAAGDAYAWFFHQAANGRRRANRIERLRMGDRVITGQAAVGQALVDHFRGFFKRGPPNSWRWTGAGASCLSPDKQGSIIGPFRVDEVRAAINGLNAEGAPGPDGIPVFFYKDCWDRVAPDVMALMDEFHAGSARIDSINRAYIALLPKVQGANQVGDFRPISLSNIIYLIIAKVLVNRLRRLLQSHINPLQFAFIPGRQMLDSIIIAEEIIVEWKRSGTTGFIWKVDFAKAYDSLDWRFL